MKKIIIILLLLPSLVVANTKNDMDSILLLISEKPFIALEKIKKKTQTNS